MPNIKSAKKRAEASMLRNEANKTKRSALRTAVKKASASLETNPENARALLAAATKKLDRAAAAGLIHKNQAARKKSRLARKMNALEKKAREAERKRLGEGAPRSSFFVPSSRMKIRAFLFLIVLVLSAAGACTRNRDYDYEYDYAHAHEHDH